MNIQVDFDMSEVVGWVNAMNSKLIDQAKASALNKVIAQAKTEMAREIAHEFNVTNAYVKERLVIRRASAAAQRFVMEATLAAAGNRRAANMIRFAEKVVSLSQMQRRARAGDRELRFKIKRVGGKKIVEGAFIGNKGRTVFVREGTARLSIKAVQTVDVASMFNAKRINEKVQSFMRTKLSEQLKHELEYFMNR